MAETVQLIVQAGALGILFLLVKILGQHMPQMVVQMTNVVSELKELRKENKDGIQGVKNSIEDTAKVQRDLSTELARGISKKVDRRSE